MSEEDVEQRAAPSVKISIDKAYYVTILLSALLIFSGVAIFFVVLREIYLTYQNVGDSLFLATVKDFFMDKPFIYSDRGSQIVFLEGSAMMISFVLFFVFASFGVSLGVRLIKIGQVLFPKRADFREECSDGSVSKMLSE